MSEGNARPRPVRDLVYRWIVGLGAAFFRVLDLRREVQGTAHVPLAGGAVLAISHFSYLDFALAEWAVCRDRRRYIRFMATMATFRHPVAGPLMRSMGHIPVDRTAGASAYRYAIDALHRGEVVGVFPETRVSRSFTLLPFKNGAARMAIQAGVPLVPCVIWGSHRVLTRTHRTRLRSARRTPVTILFGEPLHPGPKDDPNAVSEQLRVAMEGLFASAQESYPEDGSGAWWQPAHRDGAAPDPAEADRLDSRPAETVARRSA